MLTKILFTAIVILIVFLVYQSRLRPSKRVAASGQTAQSTSFKPAKWVLYTVAGILAVSSGVVYFFKWQSDNQLITIRVISAQNDDSVNYKARQKDIKGRTFTTVDGLFVTLGDSDRIELIEN